MRNVIVGGVVFLSCLAPLAASAQSPPDDKRPILCTVVVSNGAVWSTPDADACEGFRSGKYGQVRKYWKGDHMKEGLAFRLRYCNSIGGSGYCDQLRSMK